MPTSKNNIKLNNRYYVMRHGESLANRKGIIVSAPENAKTAHGLTDEGLEQARQSALSSQFASNTLIISSDYQRALETAKTVHSIINADDELIIDKRLRERAFGKWELQNHTHYAQVWENDLIAPESNKDSVESVMATLSRGLRLIERLEELHVDRTILLVGHGDVLQILLAYFKGLEPNEHRSLKSLANAEIRALAEV